MSCASTTPPRARRLQTLAGHAWATWRAVLLRRRERRDARLLDEMSNYLLRDMGLARGEFGDLLDRPLCNTCRHEQPGTRPAPSDG